MAQIFQMGNVDITVFCTYFCVIFHLPDSYSAIDPAMNIIPTDCCQATPNFCTSCETYNQCVCKPLQFTMNLMVPKHYMNCSWLFINEALRHSPECNFMLSKVQICLIGSYSHKPHGSTSWTSMKTLAATLIIPLTPTNLKGGRVYWFHLVHLSLHLSVHLWKEVLANSLNL